MSTDLAKPATAARGLKGVVAADSAICDIDGIEGRLIYRGYNIDELAQHSTFEETAYLLLKGELPNRAELAAFSKVLADHSRLPAPVLDFLGSLPTDVAPMTALRSAVSVLGVYDPHAEDGSEDGNMEGAYQK